ncbi:unnamed protein product [Pleuronectes platessa]|uniref:Uncharacterized protein n=1 Tax=Pleuronectes platessa TaxID=8262 RepID=A0A9N7Y5I3_PLEPL|nr:unnamed protein product [Pleuronectes platessa]
MCQRQSNLTPHTSFPPASQFGLRRTVQASTTLADAEWSMQVIKHDTDGSSSRSERSGLKNNPCHSPTGCRGQSDWDARRNYQSKATRRGSCKSSPQPPRGAPHPHNDVEGAAQSLQCLPLELSILIKTRQHLNKGEMTFPSVLMFNFYRHSTSNNCTTTQLGKNQRHPLERE